MKIRNLFLFILVFVGLSNYASGQTPNTTQSKELTSTKYSEMSDDDFQRIIENRYRINLRAEVADQLALSKEEITDFTPLFFDYMREKAQLEDRRENLVREYGEEMREKDQGKKEIENESADFVENYWEVEIAEMELKKDFFDRFEDQVGTVNALTFFAIEADYSRQASRPNLYTLVPYAIYLDYNYKSEIPAINELNRWSKINIEGQVGLDHEYTYNGLKKVLNAAEAIYTIANPDSDTEMLEEKTDKILSMAGEMRVEPMDTNHANLARQAFTNTAELLIMIGKESNIEIDQDQVSELREAAESIDPDQLYTEQSEHVYNFFSSAQNAINTMIEEINQDRLRETSRR